MGEAAADRSALADRFVRDVPHCLFEKGQVLAMLLRPRVLCVRHHRTDPDRPVLYRDPT